MLLPLRFLTLILVVVGMAHAATTVAPRPVSEDELEALQKAHAMEKRIDHVQHLPPEERIEVEPRLGRELKRLTRECEGTRMANQAWFWLANWQLSYEGADAALASLDRLDRMERPVLKRAGKLTRARCYLRQGRLREARALAERLAVHIPEFGALQNRIDFFEQAGKPAPGLTAQALSSSGAHDPGERDEPWVLVAFLDTQQSDDAYLLHRWRRAFSSEDLHGKLAITLVAFDGNPLLTMRTTDDLDPAIFRTLWVNPNNEEVFQQWQDTWDLPALPTWVLLGPDRSITAVEPAVDDVLALFGLDQQSRGSSLDSLRPSRRPRLNR